MSPVKSYVPPVPLNTPMRALGIATVLESRHKNFKKALQQQIWTTYADSNQGDLVQGVVGWQEFATLSVEAATSLEKLPQIDLPPTAFLSVLGNMKRMKRLSVIKNYRDNGLDGVLWAHEDWRAEKRRNSACLRRSGRRWLCCRPTRKKSRLQSWYKILLEVNFLLLKTVQSESLGARKSVIICAKSTASTRPSITRNRRISSPPSRNIARMASISTSTMSEVRF